MEAVGVLIILGLTLAAWLRHQSAQLARAHAEAAQYAPTCPVGVCAPDRAETLTGYVAVTELPNGAQNITYPQTMTREEADAYVDWSAVMHDARQACDEARLEPFAQWMREHEEER